jgi:hypothetical protein
MSQDERSMIAAICTRHGNWLRRQIERLGR